MNKPVTILMVDDDPDDQFLFLDAVKEVDIDINCISASNGVEALDYLRGNLSALPDYVFLDINMPVMDGMECLTKLKKSKQLRHIPVIIYTTTSEMGYKIKTLKRGAHHFITKPAHFDKICDCIKTVIQKYPVLG